ncbi:MAG: carbon-nitrogen hydrolase family protein [Chiayiivirga sp.]|jgi:predicted amidohydrolase|uniref:carbon-nitrogen hydrolase family protein n=1 Tax=Chiayiivirga sp. TaxID=2041042 RepID=UPI0025B9B619|nr:carbon-nitrogen hydrolase family protein [Chiayiivirga sp.]MCI1710915.1 carbon-nitrogen hydrolase family protein [Chiayiivirga sp.]MCI1728291.1 carbon-nitrogen hydrolase family protein [Chiayiivirga sp.]
MPRRARIACIQYRQRPLPNFDAFAAQLERQVAIAADYSADLAVLPEFLGLQTISGGPKPLAADAAVQALSAGYPAFVATLSNLAQRYRIDLVGGSSFRRGDDGRIHNVCPVTLRDGRVIEQAKLHATPSERVVWGVAGGDALRLIETDIGRIGVLICYDSEFPELTRRLVEQGVELLCVPFCTDLRDGYLRVRYSCAARAVENQCYVALAGNVGMQQHVLNFDQQWSQSAILTPCDFGFARDGIAAEAQPGEECVIFADLDFDQLAQARREGAVRNLADRRLDLYDVRWHGASHLH